MATKALRAIVWFEEAAHDGDTVTESTPASPKRYYRSKSDRKIAGVCGGAALYLNMDPTLVRILWFVSCFLSGIGLIAYIVFWIAAPEQ